MDCYKNIEENYGWKRNMLLQDLLPMNFAEFCGTIHISQLNDEIEKLIPEIRDKQIEDTASKEQFEEYKDYFIDFMKRTAKAIHNNNLSSILKEEEKAVLFAQQTILP